MAPNGCTAKPIGWPYACSLVARAFLPALPADPSRVQVSGYRIRLVLVIEDGVKEVVPPVALPPDIPARRTLPRHADLFQHVGGGRILRDTLRADAVQCEWAEAEGEHCPCHLSRVAVAPVRGVEFVADIRLPQLRVADA